MSLLPVAAVIVLGASLLAQSAPPLPAKTDDHPVPLCAVSGRVVTASDGAPLKSARVGLKPERIGSRRQMYAATTDSDGRFLLKDVEQGRYEFFASHPGFVDQHYQSNGSEKGATLSLKPGDKVSDVLFRMTVAAVITGRVTNDDSEALVRAQVVALRAPSDDELEDEALLGFRKRELLPVSLVQTDDRGIYRIFGLNPGEYYIQVTDSLQPDFLGMFDEGSQIREFLGSEYASAYYPGVSQVSQAQLVTLKPGEEAQADVAMHRIKTAEVAGHVIGRDGPARGAWVILQQPHTDSVAMDRQDNTDEKGSFRLKGIPPGSYVLVVYQRREHEDIYEPQARQKIEVNGDNIDSLTISLGSGVTFRGRVTIAGPGSTALDRIRIGFQSVDDDQEISSVGLVRKDGTFEIPGVQDGSYAFKIWELEDNWCVKSVRAGATDILAEGLQLEKGSAGGTLEVTLSAATAQLEGSVSNDDGVVVGARVRIVPDPESPYNQLRSNHTRTDQAGHFSFMGIPPGKYRVSARSPLSADGTSSQAEPKAVMLSENDHKTLPLKLIKPQE